MSKKLVYVVTEGWYFLQHRLPMARAARDAGFEVHVLTRIGNRRCQIEKEGFVLHPLSWGRGSSSLLAAVAATAEINGALRRIGPSIVHNVSVKPAILGSLACVPLRGVGVVNSITGLGSAFLQSSTRAKLVRAVLRCLFRLLFNRRSTLSVVQNPDDRAALVSAGVGNDRIVLIPGSGVDVGLLQATPEPPPPVTATFVGRMLEDKGVRTLVEAHRHLRSMGTPVELLLAGTADPENPSSIAEEELYAWNREPGITWLGHVTDIAGLWARSHIAVLPSRREGLPKSLLEAAACGRPLIATDAPGCREVVLHNQTGLLVPVDQPLPLAQAIATMADDPVLRRRMGMAARAAAVEHFSAEDIGRQVVEVYRRILLETEDGPAKRRRVAVHSATI